MIVRFYDFVNLAYNETVTKKIPAFFQWYDARFYPQSNVIALDYPILIQIQQQQGIDAIYEYIKCIKYEQFLLYVIFDCNGISNL